MKLVSLHELPKMPVSHNPDIHKQVMIEKGEIPRITNFTQSRIPPGVVAPAHAHTDMYEVFFVEAGEGIFRINDVAYVVSAGSCLRVDLHETHEIVNNGDEDLVLTYFGVEV